MGLQWDLTTQDMGNSYGYNYGYQDYGYNYDY